MHFLMLELFPYQRAIPAHSTLCLEQSKRSVIEGALPHLQIFHTQLGLHIVLTAVIASGE